MPLRSPSIPPSQGATFPVILIAGADIVERPLALMALADWGERHPDVERRISRGASKRSSKLNFPTGNVSLGTRYGSCGNLVTPSSTQGSLWSEKLGLGEPLSIPAGTPGEGGRYHYGLRRRSTTVERNKAG